ncbi:MAG: site-specific integrase, partial [Psychrosphaera sp.]|nr:site-specific integrase [Psychrosphaera sp.]
MRGTHKGINLFKSTGILHANKIRHPARVEDFIKKAQDEIEGQLLHGKSYGATFGEAARAYLEQGGSPRFLERVIDAMGHMRLQDITQDTLNTTAQTLYQGCKPDTINRQFFTPFIAVWKANTKGQHALCQPVEWERPRRRGTRRATVSKAIAYPDVWQFINACDRAAAEILFFLFYTGCRPIEAILLNAADVNLKDRWAILNETKTDTQRGIPIHECLVPLLQRRLAEGGRVFRNSKGVPWPDNRLTNHTGRIVSQRGGQFQTPLQTAAAKTGIKITAYAARHTVATHLIYPGGVNEVIKNEILGHGDKRDVSLDYLHLPRQAHIDARHTLPSPAGLRS